MTAEIPRVMFAALGSGGGKTSVTCAVLGALRGRGMRAAAFKCGPDYIDPMFHARVLGESSANLDLFLMGAGACRSLLAEKARGAEICVVEGVMGYYDGVGATERCSSYELARETGTPVVLVAECAGTAATLAAVLGGVLAFRPQSNIKGVIFNKLKPSLYGFYKSVVETNTPLKALGYLPELPDCRFGSRHLGLVTAPEVAGFREKTARLSAQALQTVELDALLALARGAPPLGYAPQDFEKRFGVRIAVARDAAFCFYYEDGLAALEKRGAELIPFSPLAGDPVPACDGLLLGGGYPELYLEELSQSGAALRSLRGAVLSGMPCVAECGGFLILQQSIRDASGRAFAMAGALPGEAAMTAGLRRFGYVELKARRDSLLCAAGASIAAHEFHYSDSTYTGDAFAARRLSGAAEYLCADASASRYAGYPHFHWLGSPESAERFLRACQSCRLRRERGGAR